jgi:hypothetical protein
MITDFVFNSLLKKQAYLIFLSKAIIVGFLGTNHLRNQVRRYSKSRFFLGIFNGDAPYDLAIPSEITEPLGGLQSVPG